MVFNGIVESVIFRNEDNGYTVIDFDADGRLITAVGFFPSVQAGEALTLVGEFRANPKYGEQLDVTDVRFNAPTDINGMILYLGSGLFKGVGEMTARAIVDRFGLKTLEVLTNTPMRLTEVRGIGSSRAHEIGESFKNRIEMQNTLLFLQKHGVPMGQALKIYQAYEEKTVEYMSDNPYRLIDDVEGIGFITADKIAIKLGVERDSDFRIMAGITHVLQESAGKFGHTCLPEDTLINETAQLIGTEDRERIEHCLEVMQLNRKLYKVRSGEEDPVMVYALAVYYSTENAVAAKLIRITEEARTLDIDVLREISVYEEQNGIYLHTAQKEAIVAAITGGALVITGGPGTGKTTIIKCILELLHARGLITLLAAPTGRAAKRLSEAAGTEAKTMHRLLGVEFSGGKMQFKNDDFRPLDADVIIIDEISMADIFIFHALLKAVPHGARLILVGDKDQLPSVSAGNILADVIQSKIMPVICLTEIYRQDADSLIIYNAHRINNGEMPEFNNRSRDFFIEVKEDADGILQSVLGLLTERLPKHFGFLPKEIQVLSPVKRGTAGVENLNNALQSALNPPGKRQLTVNGTVFRVGDKVMHAVNNYDLKWQKNNEIQEEGEGVFNGDIGYILEIERDEMLIGFEDGKTALYGRAEQEELILAYAVSVHKSQGCEFPAVVLAIPSASYLMMSRNLLYTAVTRAKSVVVLVGSKQNIQKMVNNHYTAKRYTLLKEFIWENRKKWNRLKNN